MSNHYNILDHGAVSGGSIVEVPAGLVRYRFNENT